MAARILDGKALSARVMESVAARAAAMGRRGITPGLAVILVGENPASQTYVRNKSLACEKCGIHGVTLRLPETTRQEELEARIRALNEDKAIHGILVQLPLPRHLDEAAALSVIAPQKDVDGFHLINGGKLLSGVPGVAPCTPKGIMMMLDATGAELRGKEAVVVGRSNIVGKPVGLMLLQRDCTVTLCHSRTANLAEHTRRADILVAAVGRAGFITGDMVKPGAIVIDVGINRVDGRVTGDVDFASAAQTAGWITPVPGGVGKMTVAMLMDNTVEAAERAEG